MRTYKIKDITNKIFSGGTPDTRINNYWNGSYPWLSSGETSSEFIYKTNKTITKEGINNSSTKLAKYGNIVIASAGQGMTRGQTSYLKLNTYINQSLIAIEANSDYVLDKYLFYWFKTKYDKLRLLSNSSSTRGSITTKMIGELSISFDSIAIQQHIVNTLRRDDYEIIN